MGAVRHWRIKTEEKTLCGRMPKDRVIDMSWPICKTCDRLSEYYPHIYKMPIQISRTPNSNPGGEGAAFSVIFETMSVTRLRDKPYRRKKTA